MQSQTLRHLIVVAICCAGVAALYLVPQPRRVVPAADPPAQPTASVPVSAAPRTRPTPVASSADATPSRGESIVVYDPEQPVNTRSPEPPPSSPTPSRSATPTPSPSASSPASSPSPTAPSSTAPSSPSPSISTSPTPSRTPSSAPSDTAPPTPPTDVQVISSTFEDLTVTWQAATDDVGVDRYQVLVDGRPAGDPVKGLRATVPWTTDKEGSEYAVTVIAADAAGNASDPSAAIAVTRPEPSPSPTPTTGSGVVPPPTGSPTAPSNRGTR